MHLGENGYCNTGLFDLFIFFGRLIVTTQGKGEESTERRTFIKKVGLALGLIATMGLVENKKLKAAEVAESGEGEGSRCSCTDCAVFCGLGHNDCGYDCQNRCSANCNMPLPCACVYCPKETSASNSAGRRKNQNSKRAWKQAVNIYSRRFENHGQAIRANQSSAKNLFVKEWGPNPHAPSGETLFG